MEDLKEFIKNLRMDLHEVTASEAAANELLKADVLEGVRELNTVINDILMDRSHNHHVPKLQELSERAVPVLDEHINQYKALQEEMRRLEMPMQQLMSLRFRLKEYLPEGKK